MPYLEDIKYIEEFLQDFLEELVLCFCFNTLYLFDEYDFHFFMFYTKKSLFIWS